MQLEEGHGATLRRRLSTAACVLLAAGAPPAAGAEQAASWQLDGSALLYGEQNRANVVEPVARITRLFANGQSLSAQFTMDAITGASPTGALPSGTVQTTTSASGRLTTTAADAIPTHPFQDLRSALDLDWLSPLGSWATLTTGGHFSHEKDYQSVGAHGRLSVDVMHHLTTITIGGGFNHDEVQPVGGTPVGLADSTVGTMEGRDPKDVTTALLGVSRVLSRRWMVGLSASRTREIGYLTEPYKVVSVVDPATRLPIEQLTEKRPSVRVRNDVLASSVYHFDRDVLYLSHRYYWDDWGVRSNTVDFKLRHDLPYDMWLQPHLRGYVQSRARFFVFGLTHGPPLPEYASSDDRLGPLRTMTLGATYGFRLPGRPGEFTIRGEYLYQWVAGQPGVNRPSGGDDGEEGGGGGGSTLLPGTSIGSILAGYTVRF